MIGWSKVDVIQDHFLVLWKDWWTFRKISELSTPLVSGVPLGSTINSGNTAITIQHMIDTSVSIWIKPKHSDKVVSSYVNILRKPAICISSRNVTGRNLLREKSKKMLSSPKPGNLFHNALRWLYSSQSESNVFSSSWNRSRTIFSVVRTKRQWQSHNTVQKLVPHICYISLQSITITEVLNKIDNIINTI